MKVVYLTLYIFILQVYSIVLNAFKTPKVPSSIKKPPFSIFQKEISGDLLFLDDKKAELYSKNVICTIQRHMHSFKYQETPLSVLRLFLYKVYSLNPTIHLLAETFFKDYFLSKKFKPKSFRFQKKKFTIEEGPLRLEASLEKENQWKLSIQPTLISYTGYQARLKGKKGKAIKTDFEKMYQFLLLLKLKYSLLDYVQEIEKEKTPQQVKELLKNVVLKAASLPSHCDEQQTKKCDLPKKKKEKDIFTEPTTLSSVFRKITSPFKQGNIKNYDLSREEAISIIEAKDAIVKDNIVPMSFSSTRNTENFERQYSKESALEKEMHENDKKLETSSSDTGSNSNANTNANANANDETCGLCNNCVAVCQVIKASLNEDPEFNKELLSILSSFNICGKEGVCLIFDMDKSSIQKDTMFKKFWHWIQASCMSNPLDQKLFDIYAKG